MPAITFIEHDGTAHTVDGEVGLSVMMTALNHDIPGIDADCGGECSCATCHVMVEPDWRAATGEASSMEAAMLDLCPHRTDRSRLSCQIDVTNELDGLIVRLPVEQV